MNIPSIELIATTLDVVGKLLVAFTALRVHHRVLNEHRISRSVFASMKREQRLGILGIFCILLAYTIEVALLSQI